MSSEKTFLQAHILYHTGIEALDKEAPDGFPRNAFGVIRGPGGGGKSVILNEMAYRAMEQGKKVIYICFEDTPISLLQNIASFGWDCQKILDNNLIDMVDCFSAQILRKTKENRYARVVKDPTNAESITEAIHSLIEDNGPSKLAGVFVDSITEFFFQSHPFKAVNAVKAWRATFCKELSIPFWAIYHTGLQQFAAYDDMITYTSDIIIDTRHEPTFANAGALVKQFRVTKVKGSRHNSAWIAFDVGHDGIHRLSIDDLREIARRITKIESPT